MGHRGGGWGELLAGAGDVLEMHPCPPRRGVSVRPLYVRAPGGGDARDGA